MIAQGKLKDEAIFVLKQEVKNLQNDCDELRRILSEERMKVRSAQDQNNIAYEDGMRVKEEEVGLENVRLRQVI